MKSHSCTAFHIAKLVSACWGVAINIEEFSNGGLVLRKVRVVIALIPFLIIINNVVSLWREERSDFLVLKDGIKNPDLIDGRLGTSVSDSCCGYESEKSKVHFPDESLVHHQEAECSVGNKSSGPAIIWSVESAVDLIQIVSSSHSEFPHVVFEQVVAVGELIGISFSFSLEY